MFRFSPYIQTDLSCLDFGRLFFVPFHIYIHTYNTSIHIFFITHMYKTSHIYVQFMYFSSPHTYKQTQVFLELGPPFLFHIILPSGPFLVFGGGM